MSYRSFGIRLTLLSMLAIGASTGVAQQELSTFATLVMELRPNYVGTMLPPIEGNSALPVLFRNWRHFPLRVAVIDNDPFYSEAGYSDVCKAADRWCKATKDVRGGGVSFIVLHTPDPTGADVIVRLCSNQELSGYGGFTYRSPTGGVTIQLSATRSSGKQTDDWLLERVATHEMGHALGIWGHSPDPRSIMSNNYEARDVTVEDVNTLLICYGGAFPRSR